MSPRVFRVVAACALLALAGCAAPVADDPALRDAGPSTSTPGDAPETDENATTTTSTNSAGPGSGVPRDGVVVAGGDLAPDANRTYERVQALLGTEFRGARVVVRDLSGYKTADYSRVPFLRLFGVSNPSLADGATGLTTLGPTVYVWPAGADSARVEQLLAHEFVHVAQLREEMVPWFGSLSLRRVSLDERLARRALLEGGAVYVADAYTRRHLGGSDAGLQSERVTARYANGSSGDRVVWSQYRFGYRYVNATIDDPAELASVYDDPPRTTENVLHPGERDAPTPLSVRVEADDYAEAVSPTSRAGELVARIVLRDVVGAERARNASDGWGNDRVVVFETNGTRSLAWVTRWETTRDADEFAAAVREVGDQPDAAEAFRVERLDDRTVVAFAGTADFVETASASGNVTIAA